MHYDDRNEKKYVRYQEGAEMYSVSEQSFRRLAKEAQAIYKIRNLTLVNLAEFDNYIKTFKI
jgi:hypothetical protein